MSGFGLGHIDFEPDDDTEAVDRTNPDEWPEFDWTPIDGDPEDGTAPEPPADNVQDDTVTTAPGSNLVTAPSFEATGTWTGWEVPYPWDFMASAIVVSSCLILLPSVCPSLAGCLPVIIA